MNLAFVGNLQESFTISISFMLNRAYTCTYNVSVDSHLVQNRLRIDVTPIIAFLRVTPTCWQELPSPNGFNTNSSRPKAAPKQRYS